MIEREEFIEQAYFFRVVRERIRENVPAQDVLLAIGDEILATTKLPMAIEFLRGEIMHQGTMGEGMSHLGHYFTAFQAFVMQRAEAHYSRFHPDTALQILEREATYKSEAATPAGLFIYQFECLARNRLGYRDGLRAVAADPFYSPEWTRWIRRIDRHLGDAQLSELVYLVSEQFRLDVERQGRDFDDRTLLFGPQEGKIARANQGKDPLYFFAALQRQLNYPAIPRQKSESENAQLPPAVEARLQRMEKQIQLLEMESKGKVDLSQFLQDSPKFDDDGVSK